MNEGQLSNIPNNDSQRGHTIEKKNLKKKSHSSKRRPKTSTMPFKITDLTYKK